MKKLLIILMFVPLVSFGQTNPAGNLGKNRPDKYTIKDSRGNKIGTLEGESKPFQGWDYTAPARAAEESRRNSDKLSVRIYPVEKSSTVNFFGQDGEIVSTIVIDNPDWDNFQITEENNEAPVEYKKGKNMIEFSFEEGRNYTIR